MHVRLNGALSVRLGSSCTLDVGAGVTVGDVIELLVARHPTEEGLLRRAVPVVGGRIVPTDFPLTGREELALLMPQAGGS